MMIDALNQFDINIEETRKTSLLATSISLPASAIINISSILRSCIVLSVSALDHLIHELVLTGMIDIFSGSRPSTSRYLKHGVSLGFVNSLASLSPAIAFEAEIRKSLGWQTFQRPNKIKEAVSLFSNIPLWQQVALRLGDSEINIKNQLDLIIDRRNMIAHEADIEPVYKSKRVITATDVTKTIDFIEKLGHSIYDVIL